MTILVLIITCLIVIWLVLLCRSHKSTFTSSTKPLVRVFLNSGCVDNLGRVLYGKLIEYSKRYGFVVEVVKSSSSKCETRVEIYPNGKVSGVPLGLYASFNQYSDVMETLHQIASMLGIYFIPNVTIHYQVSTNDTALINYLEQLQYSNDFGLKAILATAQKKYTIIQSGKNFLKVDLSGMNSDQVKALGQRIMGMMGFN